MKAGAVDFLTKPTMSGRPAGGSQSISNTFFQPFPRYTTKGAWTFGLNAELMYDWTHSRWTVPINATVPKLTCIGKQALSLGAEGRYYADSPDACPHGWGARVTGMFLFFRMTCRSRTAQ
jgi:hypothetical protein